MGSSLGTSFIGPLQRRELHAGWDYEAGLHDDHMSCIIRELRCT